MRFLEEAAKGASLHVLLWCDELIRSVTGKEPKFPQEERLYMLDAIRYVDKVAIVGEGFDIETVGDISKARPDTWVVDERSDTVAKKEYCRANGIAYKVVAESELQDFPDCESVGADADSKSKKVVVTGCFDWFHSGHVRFLEEVSEYGDLYAIVGHDKNIELLKGQGHPMFGEQERRYVLASIRFVKRAIVSTGDGWMDAEPEILELKADIYAVNKDGDKPEKAEFCKKHGLEYLVLKRLPKKGLTRRESTDLRGF
jgi:cytidyltransferase-like protein